MGGSGLAACSDDVNITTPFSYSQNIDDNRHEHVGIGGGLTCAAAAGWWGFAILAAGVAGMQERGITGWDGAWR